MQEQKRYQIEKVNHTNIYESHICCVVDYYGELDLLGQINYTDENFARENKYYRSVGMWRIKQQNFKQSKN